MNDTTNPLENAPQHVQGYSVLWAVLAIVFASCTHPLGSSCGLDSDYREYLRALPLSCLKDTLQLLGDVMCFGGREEITLHLLKRMYPKEEKFGPWSFGKAHRLQKDTSVWSRLLPNALVLLAFVKLCSISGIWGSIAVASIYFFSWLVLEGALLYVLLYRGSYKDWEVSDWFFERLSRPTEPGRNAILLPTAQLLSMLTWIVVSQKKGPTISATLVILRYLSTPAIKMWTWTTHLTWTYLINDPHGSGFFSFIWHHIFLQCIEIGVVYALIALVLVVYSVPALLLLWSAVLFFKLGTWILHLLGLPLLRGLRAARIGCCVLLAGLIYYYVHIFDGKGTSQRSWGSYLP
jgi:hypothetical protein